MPDKPINERRADLFSNRFKAQIGAFAALVSLCTALCAGFVHYGIDRANAQATAAKANTAITEIKKLQTTTDRVKIIEDHLAASEKWRDKMDPMIVEMHGDIKWLKHKMGGPE